MPQPKRQTAAGLPNPPPTAQLAGTLLPVALPPPASPAGQNSAFSNNVESLAEHAAGLPANRAIQLQWQSLGAGSNIPVMLYRLLTGSATFADHLGAIEDELS